MLRFVSVFFLHKQAIFKCIFHSLNMGGPEFNINWLGKTKERLITITTKGKIHIPICERNLSITTTETEIHAANLHSQSNAPLRF